MLGKLKWQLPGEPLVARYNWCRGPVPGRGPAVEKHCSGIWRETIQTGKTA